MEKRGQKKSRIVVCIVLDPWYLLPRMLYQHTTNDVVKKKDVSKTFFFILNERSIQVQDYQHCFFPTMIITSQ